MSKLWPSEPLRPFCSTQLSAMGRRKEEEGEEEIYYPPSLPWFPPITHHCNGGISIQNAWMNKHFSVGAMNLLHFLFRVEVSLIVQIAPVLVQNVENASAQYKGLV